MKDGPWDITDRKLIRLRNQEGITAGYRDAHIRSCGPCSRTTGWQPRRCARRDQLEQELTAARALVAAREIRLGLR